MYKRIVVPLDGSGLAEQALPHAVAQAGQFGAEVILLKVLEPLRDAVYSAPAAMHSAEEMSAQLAHDYLEASQPGSGSRALRCRSPRSRDSRTWRSSATPKSREPT